MARGLLNHYFGTKRDLYLEVVRALVTLPELDDAAAFTGPLASRVQHSVDWFLDTVSVHAKTFVAVTGAEGVGDDPEIERILADADDTAARKVLEMVGLPADAPAHRAVIRAYGGLVKAAVREWVRNETPDPPAGAVAAQPGADHRRAGRAARHGRAVSDDGRRATEHATYCRICEPTCGMVATVEDGRLVQLRPDREHPITKGFSCPKGIEFVDVQNDPDRLLYPMRRTSSGDVRTHLVDDRAGRDRRPPARDPGRPRRWVDRLVRRQPVGVQPLARAVVGRLRPRPGLPAPVHAQHPGHVEPVRRLGAALRQPDHLPAARPEPDVVPADGRCQPGGVARVAGLGREHARQAHRHRGAWRPRGRRRSAPHRDGEGVRARRRPPRR